MMVQVTDVDKQNSCVPAGHAEAVVSGAFAESGQSIGFVVKCAVIGSQARDQQ